MERVAPEYKKSLEALPSDSARISMVSRLILVIALFAGCATGGAREAFEYIGRIAKKK